MPGKKEKKQKKEDHMYPMYHIRRMTPCILCAFQAHLDADACHAYATACDEMRAHMRAHEWGFLRQEKPD